MNEAVLSQNEWNFDDVPDNELVACCHWEYARESAFLREFKKRWTAWDGSHPCPDGLDRGLNRIEQASPVVFARLQSILSSASFPDAWQTLAQPERDSLLAVDLAPPPPFQRRGSVTEAERLLEEAHERVRESRAAEEKLHQQYPGIGSATLRRRGKWPEFDERCSILWCDGTESTIIQIGWEHHTNEQIVEAFKDWVKRNRPKDIPTPDGRGHKTISWRVALEHLAILRLLHRFTLVELKTSCPEAWRHFAAPNRRWARDAEKARAQFRQLFPFLEPLEQPLSWPPKREPTSRDKIPR